MKGITNPKEIKEAIQELTSRLLQITDEKTTIRYSSKGGINDPVEASYSEKYGLWWFFGQKETQYYNPFGLGVIRYGQAVTGKCQINVAKKGSNARLGGAYARNESGGLMILHNGKFGGGTPGIGKNAFARFYSAHTVEIDFDGKKSDYYLVAELDAPQFFEQLKFFVEQVYYFKGTVLRRSPISNQLKNGFYDGTLENGESTKRTAYRLKQKDILPNADHARITNELLRTLNENGYQARRNRYIDAFIISKKRQFSHIFEVKSKLNTQTLYTAVGQLMMYNINQNAIKIFVIEGPVTERLRSDLFQLRIYCLTYTWKKKMPYFADISIIDSFI